MKQYLYKPASRRGMQDNLPERLCTIEKEGMSLIPGIRMVYVKSADKSFYWTAICPETNLRPA